ncbi:MAG: hypothetical protein QOK32_1501 [Gaiellaceae bacterium]|nr:hypothetical protein [Gaiellaceae bacterium]
MESSRARLVGNRIALVGAALYFCEWIAILAIPSVPTDKLGRDPHAVLAAYDHPKAIGVAAGWFSVVLFGRVIFTLGLRDAFRGLRREGLFANIAVASMALSVAIEVISFGITAAAAWVAAWGGSQDAVVSLDAASEILFELVFGPIGVSVVAGAIAMLLSRLFARWLCWVGLVGGSLLVVGGILGVGGLGATGTFHDVAGAFTSIPVPIVWVWMIATSIVLYRAAPSREVTTSS